MKNYFHLPTESKELKGSSVKSFAFKQYPATRDVSGTSFSNGAQTWRWQGASNQWWIPSKSYMRFRLSIKTGADAQPTESQDLAPAMNIASQFYQSMSMKMGGNTVSTIGDYVAQIDTLKKRLGYSKSVLDGLEDSKGFMDADFKVRQSKICSDGFYLEDISEPVVSSALVRTNLGYDPGTNTIAYDSATGVITFAAAGGSPLPTPYMVGDHFQLIALAGGNPNGTLTGVPAKILSVTDATTIAVAPGSLGGSLAADIGDFERIRGVKCANDALGANEFEVIWRPPLSLFDCDHPLPMNCMYEMILNPHTSESIQRRIVQTLTSSKTPDQDFKVGFQQAYLYLAEVDGPPIEDKSFILDLREMSIQTEQVTNSDLSQKNFDVSPSTKALTVFYQDTRANAGTQVSDGLLRSYPAALTAGSLAVGALSEEKKLKRFYLQYAGQNPLTIGLSVDFTYISTPPNILLINLPAVRFINSLKQQTLTT